MLELDYVKAIIYVRIFENKIACSVNGIFIGGLRKRNW